MSLPYVIVPVYNGALYIDEFLDKLSHEWISQLIFVDDGSNDASCKLLLKHGVNVITHRENLGKGASIQSAINWIKDHGGKSAITIDIDLQHPPDHIDTFRHIPDKTILLGYRYDRRSMPLSRQFSNFITSLLISVRSGNVIKDSQCGYRGFQLNLMDKLTCHQSGFHFESEFLIKASIIGWKIKHLNIPTIYGNQISAMNHVTDTVIFMKMWFQSYLWT